MAVVFPQEASTLEFEGKTNDTSPAAAVRGSKCAVISWEFSHL